MSILIEKVRVYGFRGLHNIEVPLEQTTVLTGMNNAGKTSFLKALQIALGNSQFISPDDFYISETFTSEKIIIDIKIIPVDFGGKQIATFDPEWEILFGADRLITDTNGNSFVPLRTVVALDSIKSTYKTSQFIQREWTDYEVVDGASPWFEVENGSEKSFHFDEIPFFYMDAQRDIVDDMKVRNSYLGKMLSNIKYSIVDIGLIEEQIRLLNEKAVNSSNILKNIETTLKELDSAMENASNGIDITPFPKKVRDLNRGVSIQYSDFSMEYHGMGTRSWSSLLTLKSFISLFAKNSEENHKLFFPLVCIEEPEAHLHPNAQKKLYGQIASISGQKIISTHSPYIAASAELKQIRSFYKEGEIVKCGIINISEFTLEEIRKISREVVLRRGELFFSKLIVLCEGETEEQSLPLFAEGYFEKSAIEIGIDFVGVSGAGNYLPFVRLAKSLNIPWFIFSDGEDPVIKKIKKDLKDLYKREIDLADEQNILILENGYDFEKYLLEYGYGTEVQVAFSKLFPDGNLEYEIKKRNGTSKGRMATVNVCKACNQTIYRDVLRDYTGDEGFKKALYDLMTDKKTPFGPAVTDAIIESGKSLPPKVIELFEKINQILKIKK